MTNKSYSKKDIIELTKKYGELEHDFEQTTLEKRLEKIIEFLQKEEVQYVLEQQSNKDSGAYFYNNEMNLTKAKGDAFKEYNYNLIDAIFLAVLISLYDQSLLSKLHNQSKINNPDQEGKLWNEAFTNKLNGFKAVWNEVEYQKTWEVISVNLKSLAYRFTLLPTMNTQAKELQNNLYGLVELFEGLPDHHKIAFYNQAMKSRIPTMLKKIEEYIQSLKDTTPDEYREYTVHKGLVEIDRQLETDNGLNEYQHVLKNIDFNK